MWHRNRLVRYGSLAHRTEQDGEQVAGAIDEWNQNMTFGVSLRGPEVLREHRLEIATGLGQRVDVAHELFTSDVQFANLVKWQRLLAALRAIVLPRIGLWLTLGGLRRGLSTGPLGMHRTATWNTKV